MDFATPFQLDSISLPAWAETTIRNTRQAAAYSHRVFKAFNKTFSPVIAETAKDLGHYYYLCGQGAGQWAMNPAGITHNPLQAAVRAAQAELTSAEAQTTYRRIRHITRQTAMTVLSVGLRGVVALSVGIELAQAGYRAAEKLYRTVYGRLNPSEPVPELLPSVALAANEWAAALDNFAEVAEADVMAKAEAEAIAEVVPDFWSEPLPLVHTPPVVGPVWNPEIKNMHLEVAARLQYLHYVPLTLSPAPEPVAQPVQEPVRRGRSKAEAQPKAPTKAKRKPAKESVI
jgi:hypothetical protein